MFPVLQPCCFQSSEGAWKTLSCGREQAPARWQLCACCSEQRVADWTPDGLGFLQITGYLVKQDEK